MSSTAERPLSLSIVGYFYDEDLGSPEELLDRYASTTAIENAIAAAGIEVSVLQRFHRRAEMERRGVKYHFVADGLPNELGRWTLPRAFHSAVCSVPADIVHVHSYFAAQSTVLRSQLSCDVAMVHQDHGAVPPKGWDRRVLRYLLRHADRFFFSASELGRAWVEAGVIRSEDLIHTVMEGSTHFRKKDRIQARLITGMAGDPIVLWVGRLNANKDPLVVLAGFRELVNHAPDAHLYMLYHEADLEYEVTDLIARAGLADSVTLIGTVPHNDIEPYFNSADFFLLGSHKEGSGYALLEALACGVVPVVTDIPSFRSMTRNGRIGRLWQTGNSASCAAALLSAIQCDWNLESEKACDFFLTELSFEAIARQSVEGYQNAVARRKIRAGSRTRGGALFARGHRQVVERRPPGPQAAP